MRLGRCVGWASNIIGASVFGRRGRGIPRDVPLGPLGTPRRLGFDATGALAAMTARVAPPARA